MDGMELRSAGLGAFITLYGEDQENPDDPQYATDKSMFARRVLMGPCPCDDCPAVAVCKASGKGGPILACAAFFQFYHDRKWTNIPRNPSEYWGAKVFAQED